MINDKVDEVIEKRFQSFLCRCQIGLETLMKGSEFVFECVHLLHYKCNKVIQIKVYINTDWIKSKEATINPIKKKKIVNASNMLWQSQ